MSAEVTDEVTDLSAPLTTGVLSRTDIVRFAGACGDFNPIHHDETHAVALGHPSVFAMGMLTAGMLGAYVTGWAPLGEIRDFSVRFTAPAWPGEDLRFETVARELSADGDRYTVAARGGDEVKIEGSVRVGGPFRSPSPDPGGGDLLGRELPTVRLPVERGKIMEVARAVHSRDPVHLDRDAARAAGWPDLPAPLVFTAAASHWAGGDASDVPRRLGLDLDRVLHGEHHWRFVRTPVAGDELTGTRRVTSAVRKTSRSGTAMLLVRVSTDYRDASGGLVLGEDMVAVERGRPV